MIRNIVFDMGNVLIDYQPMEYTRRFFPDPSEAAQVCTELFGGPEWPLLDQGTIEPQAALRQICERLPDSLRARTEELFCHWFDQLTIIPETNALGKQMKENGIPPIYPLECRLQLLSILFLYPNLPAVGRLYRLRRRKVGET